MDGHKFRTSAVGSSLIQFITHPQVNLIFTGAVILLATYLSLTAITERNVLHPITIPSNFTVQHTAEDIVQTTISLFLLGTAALAAGKIVSFFALPPLIGSLLIGLLFGNVSVFTNLISIQQRWITIVRNLTLTLNLIRSAISFPVKGLNNQSALPIGLCLISTTVEAVAMILAATFLFGFPVVPAICLGFALAAVAQASSTPIMIDMQNEGFGTAKRIPTLVIASNIVDNIYTIIAFFIVSSIFYGMQPPAISVFITLGEILLGFIFGGILGAFMCYFPLPNQRETDGCRLLLLITVSTVFVIGGIAVGFECGGIIATCMSSLIAAYQWRNDNENRVYNQERSLTWLANAVLYPLVFALFGFTVDLRGLTWPIFFTSAVLVLIGLVARLISSIFATCCSPLNFREKLLVALTMLPKATVQAILIPSLMLLMPTEHLQMVTVTAAWFSMLLTCTVFHIILFYTTPMLLKYDENLDSRVYPIYQFKPNGQNNGDNINNGATTRF